MELLRDDRAEPEGTRAGARSSATRVPGLAACALTGWGGLAQVGTLAHQRLTVMMADTGLVQGTIAPESDEDFSHVVEQALAAVKRYASSAMLASAVAPRSNSPSSSRASGGHSTGGAAGFDARGEASFGTDMSDSGRTSTLEGDGKSQKLHACRNCQKAKTACTDQRPCARCLRLQACARGLGGEGGSLG